MGQNAVSQSNSRVSYNVISQEKWMMKCIFGMQINIEVFYKLVLSFWVCVTSMPKVPKIRSFHIFAISPEKHGLWNWSFCLQINTKMFYKVIVSLWVWIVRHVQSTQNNKFTISLEYLKKNVKDEVDFLPADKHQIFLQIGTIILGVCGQACPSYPK